MNVRINQVINIAIGVALGVAITLTVAHQFKPPNLSPFDANGDDRISLTEFRAFMASIFEQADSRRDGILDKTEQDEARTKLRPSLAQTITMTFRLVKIDRNRDGELSKSEFLDPESLETMFGQLDKNDDMWLSRGEGDELAFELLFPG